VRSTLEQYLSVQVNDELTAQRGRSLLVLILTIGIADLITLTIDMVTGTTKFLTLELAVLVILFVLYWCTRRGQRWTPYVFLIFLTFITTDTFLRDPVGLTALALAAPVVVTPLIAAPRLCIPVAGGEAATLYAMSFALDYPLKPLGLVILGVLGLVAWLSSSNLESAFRESQRNASALVKSNRELQSSRALLEANARDLERRSNQLEAAARVAQAATSILETDRLIREVVEVIRERFGLYYVGLFLTDEIGGWAVLQAGTGEAGRAMLARGHRLRVSDDSMIGWSIAHSQARVTLEIEEDPVRLATPELPDTRSEAALPLRSRGQVLGALTVQSEQSEAFDQDTIAVLQTMVDQVAVAIDNAHLFSEAEAALEATRRAYGELSREGWAELLRTQSGLGYRSGKRGVTRTGGIRRSELEQALQKRASLRGSDTDTEDNHPLAVPVKVRGNVVGVLNTHKSSEAGEWTSEEVRLLETLAEQVGVALESARLYRDAQRRAAHERLVGEITDKMSRAADIDMLMQTTIQEMATALDVPSAFVQFGAAPGMAWDEDGG